MQKDNLLTGRKYLQMIQPTKVSFSKYTNSSYNSKTRKQTVHSKQPAKDLNRHFSKEDTEMAKDPWKNAQHFWSSEKCKSKSQWGITSHWSEWSSAKSLQTINAREGVEKREFSHTVGGNVNWCRHYGNQYGKQFLKNLKIELPYDPAISLLGIYPEKTVIRKDRCTLMFIAALFTICLDIFSARNLGKHKILDQK